MILAARGHEHFNLSTDNITSRLSMQYTEAAQIKSTCFQCPTCENLENTYTIICHVHRLPNKIGHQRGTRPEWRRIGEGGFNDWTASYDLPTDLDGLVWWILKKKVVEKVGALLDYHIHLKIFDETQIIYSPTNPDRGQTRGWRINLMMLPWLAMKYKKNNWNLKLGNCILLSVKRWSWLDSSASGFRK